MHMLFSFVGLILHLLTTPRLNNRNYGFGAPLGYLQHKTLGLVIFVGVTYGQEMFALFRKECPHRDDNGYTDSTPSLLAIFE